MCLPAVFNFLQAATLFTVFLFISLIISNTLTRSTDLDGQQVAIIVISGIFFLFTSLLLGAHTRLLMLNMTTIEEMGLHRQMDRENHMLNREFGFMGWREKRRTKARWNKEWGKLGTEANLWWLGSSRANFVSVMGESKWGWFCELCYILPLGDLLLMMLPISVPIPASPHGDDGISYVPNPRFSDQGIQRRREEWPEELR